PASPGPAYVWLPGHWAWRGARRGYVWGPGLDARPAPPAGVWGAAACAPRPGGWVWVEGHWRARRGSTPAAPAGGLRGRLREGRSARRRGRGRRATGARRLGQKLRPTDRLEVAPPA